MLLLCDSSKILEKYVYISTEILSSPTVFKIDTNMKSFLSIKSAY